MLTTEFKPNVTVTEEGVVIGDEQDISNKIPSLDNPPVITKTDPPASDTPADRETIINSLPEDIQTYDIKGIDLNTLTTVEIKDGETVQNGFKTNDGHIIDKDGNVLLTARQLYELQNPSESTDDTPSTDLTIDTISKLSGITLTDETGNPLVFESTPEGFAAREAKIQEVAINKGKQEALTEFFSQNEDIKDLYLFKTKNGSIENYKPSTDLINVTLTKEDTNNLETIIIQAQVAKGDTLEKAQRFVNYSKSDNKLYEDAVEAQTFLKDKVTREETSKQDALRKKALEYYGFTYEDDKEVIINNEGSLYNTIVTKGKIGDFVIPTTGVKVKQEDGTIKVLSRRDVLNYVALAADENGNSQADIDFAKRLSNPTEKLLLYLTTLMHGNLSQLSNELAKQDKISKAKQVIEVTKQQPISNNSNTVIKFNLPVK